MLGQPLARVWRTLGLVCCVMLVVWPVAADAHDASGWGGLFRSRDGGATWFQANQGRLVAGALAIAIDPSDANHVLLATDYGLLVTRNGGLDWHEATSGPGGPVFAVAVDRHGRQLAATARGLFSSDGGDTWSSLPTLSGMSPVRALVAAGQSGRIYLLGWNGLFRSDDWGATWTGLDSGLPDGSVASLVVLTAPAGDESLVCLINGQVWTGDSAGRSWHHQTDGLPDARMQVLALDPGADVLWAAGADRVFRSDNGGRVWQSVGQPLPNASTDIRGLAASPDHNRLVLSTHRGVYTTVDAGATWSVLTDNLPAHIEAGPLVRDPVEPQTLYVGFALTPYDEQWRRVADGGQARGRLSLPDVVGAVAFLLLLALGAGLLLHWLARRQPPHAAEPVA
jgi:photosystem II stability/assembly factor-like uncharacterized protein